MSQVRAIRWVLPLPDPTYGTPPVPNRAAVSSKAPIPVHIQLWDPRPCGYLPLQMRWTTVETLKCKLECPMCQAFVSRCLSTLLVALFAFGSSSLTALAEKQVRVYNWSDYIDESILKEFTAETGIKVIYDVFDSNEVLETKLLAGKSGYDLVVPSGQFLSRQIRAGVFQKLDKSKLPNMKNLWPVISERVAVYDPGNEFAITYMWGTTGIGYNEAKIKERLQDAPVNSWDLVFKPEIAAKFKDCGIMMLDAPDDVMSAAAKYLGLTPTR